MKIRSLSLVVIRFATESYVYDQIMSSPLVNKLSSFGLNFLSIVSHGDSNVVIMIKNLSFAC